MSSDLWSAFASTSEDPTSNPWAQNAQHGVNSRPSLQNPSHSVEGSSFGTLKSSSPGFPDPWSGQVGTSFAQSPWQGDSAVTSKTIPTPPLRVVPNNQIHENGEDDEFGDFEEAEAGASAAPQGTSLKLLPDGGVHQRAKSKNAPSLRDQQQPHISDPYANLDQLVRRPSSQNATRSAPTTKPEASTRKPSLALVEDLVPYTEDEWGEFSPESATHNDLRRGPVRNEGSKPGRGPASSYHTRSQSTPSTTSTTAQKPSRASQWSTSPPKLAPTNVPPPSILINLVSSLVEKLPQQVERVMKNLDAAQKSEQRLEGALRRCIASLRVAARIVAGRKVRWRRDQHLAQSMRIGPAGKAGGMKLAGVDKAEVQREDREAAEFARIWQQKLGGIRSALAMVNSNIAGQPIALPGISATMVIKALKSSDGATVSTKCCFLCGLKREERVDKVDVDVWDNFEEFWTDNWGHSQCRVFWLEHEGYLQERK